jgi:hypothetical protein
LEHTRRAEKLVQYYDRIMSCRVAVESPPKYYRHGNRYHIRVAITVPDGGLMASREPDEHQLCTDL